MYRVLIVDDENLIVDSLHEYIYSRRSEVYDIVKACSASAAYGILQRMLHQITQLTNELEHCDAISGETVRSILGDLIQDSGEDRPQNNILSLTLERIDQYMEEHFAEDISLTDIAGHVYLSASYVSRIYKKMCEINIIERLQQIRIRKSKELLSETNIKVQDVALSVGFNSPRYFCSVFKKNTGYTPQEYREKYTVLQQ